MNNIYLSTLLGSSTTLERHRWFPMQDPAAHLDLLQTGKTRFKTNVYTVQIYLSKNNEMSKVKSNSRKNVFQIEELNQINKIIKNNLFWV